MSEVTILLTDEIVDDVCRHVIGFVNFQNDGKNLASGGSGTMVRLGKVRGILTAAHVARALPKGDVGILSFLKPNRNLKQNTDFIRCVDIWDGKEKSAPDIALIAIPDVDANKIEVHGGVFYNLEKDRTFVVSDEANIITKSYVISGVVAEWSANQNGNKSTKAKTEFGGIWGAAENVEKIQEGNVDLVSLQIRDSPDLPVPRSYGGVSGSGLWELHTEITPSLKVARVGKKLCGVAFREENKGTANHSIICNAQSSIARQIAKAIQEWGM